MGLLEIGDCVWVLEFFPALLLVGLFVGLAVGLPLVGEKVGGLVVTSNVETTVSLMTAVIVPLELVLILSTRLPLEMLVSRA